jgi:hypothetical protein
MVTAAAERSILELRRSTNHSSHRICVRSNPSPEVIFLGPHLNVRSRFLSSVSFFEAFLHRFNEILAHAHGMFTSSKVVIFFVIL